jgi:hypothetical protein
MLPAGYGASEWIVLLNIGLAIALSLFAKKLSSLLCRANYNSFRIRIVLGAVLTESS